VTNVIFDSVEPQKVDLGYSFWEFAENCQKVWHLHTILSGLPFFLNSPGGEDIKNIGPCILGATTGFW